MKRFINGVVVMLIALAMIPMSSAFAYKGEFIINNGAEPQSLDPALIQGVPEHRLYYSLFEGLVTSHPETAEPLPGLAESWKASNNGATYTFKLRKTTWSDGVPITAHTVVKSWLRQLDPKTASPYAWFPSMFIKGGADFNGGKGKAEDVGIKAIDDYTFELNMVGPLPYVLGALSHYSFAIVPLHAIEKHGTAWTSPGNFVGNGPFVLEKWDPQSRLTVVPNQKYWDKETVSLERITYIPSDDNNTTYNMYVNGEADWHANIPLDQMDEAQLRDDYQGAPYLGTYYYQIQNEVKPFDDARVRKALSLAINRQHIVEKITRSGETVAYSMVPDMAGYAPANGEAEDVEKAKKYLADAGFPGGKGFPEFSILYNTHEAHKKIAEFIQQEWSEKLGLKVSLRNEEWKTYLNNRNAGQFEVARAGWIGDYRDPNTFLDMFITGGPMNGGKYSNAEYDRLIKEAGSLPPGKERMAALAAAEKHFIQNDQGVIPIYGYVTRNMLDQDKWGGWYPNVMDWHPTKYIHLKD